MCIGVLSTYIGCHSSLTEELKNQCCGAGAGGAKIILVPGAGAENKC